MVAVLSVIERFTPVSVLCVRQTDLRVVFAGVLSERIFARGTLVVEAGAPYFSVKALRT